MKFTFAHLMLPALAILTLFPFISSGMALILGAAAALILGNPYLEHTRRLTPKLLSLSVMGLGAGMNLAVVARAGMEGFGYTILGIAATLALGTAIGRWLNIERDTSLLLTVGTAICGGSAIAAVAPTIRAKSHTVSVALGTVFLLNACALLIFPGIGHALGLTEAQFGLWSALAIHDTSSVVGATSLYGPHALEIGTTVKLARALWIVPLTIAIAHFRPLTVEADRDSPTQKPKRPWFILGFLAAAALVTWIPVLQPAGHVAEKLARQTLILTLFLIGANLTRATLRSVGIRPLAQGVALWMLVASGSLAVILISHSRLNS